MIVKALTSRLVKALTSRLVKASTRDCLFYQPVDLTIVPIWDLYF